MCEIHFVFTNWYISRIGSGSNPSSNPGCGSCKQNPGAVQVAPQKSQAKAQTVVYSTEQGTYGTKVICTPQVF